MPASDNYQQNVTIFTEYADHLLLLKKRSFDSEIVILFCLYVQMHHSSFSSIKLDGKEMLSILE